MAQRTGSEALDVLSYPVGLRFECQRCSRCCADTEARERRILLLKAEVERISAARGMPQAMFTLPNLGDQAYTFLMRKVDGRCIFLRGKECTVYEMRPLVCRFYPFELRRSKGGGYELIGTQESCPGLGRGRPLSDRFFRTLFSYAQDLFSGLQLA